VAKELTVRKSVTLNADACKVWDALTNPQLTKHYMYNCEVISDWKVGSPLIWKGAEDGKEYVKGNIVSIDPGRRLQFTTFDPNSEMKDTAANYTTVTYELKAENGTTELTVSQGDFSKVADGEKRYQHTVGGWDLALKGLKELLEK
jgi:uncharacterized protein YndB with AHSA1/START domain